MRKACVVLGMVAVVCLCAASAVAQEAAPCTACAGGDCAPCAGGSCTAGADGCAVDTGCGCGPATDCGCAAAAHYGCLAAMGCGWGAMLGCGCGPGCCGACCGVGCSGCHAAHIASIGYFNCNCRGSYKFPVPPRYTYHWPGMYSQQYMTEYNSPYRFPPLELPKEYLPSPADQVKADSPFQPAARSAQPTGDAPSRPDSRQARPRLRPEPLSAKMKRRYGIR